MDKNKFKSNQKSCIGNREEKLGKAYLQKAFPNTTWTSLYFYAYIWLEVEDKPVSPNQNLEHKHKYNF